MLKRSFMLLALLFFACSCTTGVEIPWGPNADVSQLEERIYDKTPDGEDALVVRPNIASRDDLLRYRDMKILEAQEILELTEERGGERPYFPVVITLAQPIPISELNDMLSGYDPSMEKSIAALGPSKSVQLGKAQFEKGVDRILPNIIRFNSTTGRGQLSYDSMSDGKQMARMEDELAKLEREQNGIEGFELVAGVRSVMGGVHRDGLMALYDDSRVFLADIGPIELYRGDVVTAYWDDVSDLVSTYLSR